MEQLMDPMAAMMKNLGNPEITAELKQTITEGVLREAGNRSVEQLAQDEDEMLLGWVLLTRHSMLSSVASTSSQSFLYPNVSQLDLNSILHIQKLIQRSGRAPSLPRYARCAHV
jgi:hypothetical protein